MFGHGVAFRKRLGVDLPVVAFGQLVDIRLNLFVILRHEQAVVRIGFQHVLRCFMHFPVAAVLVDGIGETVALPTFEAGLLQFGSAALHRQDGTLVEVVSDPKGPLTAIRGGVPVGMLSVGGEVLSVPHAAVLTVNDAFAGLHPGDLAQAAAFAVAGDVESGGLQHGRHDVDGRGGGPAFLARCKALRIANQQRNTHRAFEHAAFTGTAVVTEHLAVVSGKENEGVIQLIPQ